MEVAERRQPLRASERPLRATGSGQEAASGEPGSTDPGAGENGPRGAERRIVRRFCSRSSMPCMPVVSQAGNQVTWNHFFWLAPTRGQAHFPRSAWKMRLSPCWLRDDVAAGLPVAVSYTHLRAHETVLDLV